MAVPPTTLCCPRLTVSPIKSHCNRRDQPTPGFPAASATLEISQFLYLRHCVIFRINAT